MAKMTEKITARAAPVRLLPFFCLSERKSISVIKVIMRSMTPAKMMCLAEKIPAVTYPARSGVWTQEAVNGSTGATSDSKQR